MDKETEKKLRKIVARLEFYMKDMDDLMAVDAPKTYPLSAWRMGVESKKSAWSQARSWILTAFPELDQQS